MCKTVCPQCGYEFTAEREPQNSGKWTPEEDKQLLHSYQVERKLLSDIADDMNRSQDAIRNRLYVLRGAGKSKGVSVEVKMTSKEYDEMRTARDKLATVNDTTRQLKKTAAELAELCTVVNELLSARKNHRNAAPVYDRLTELTEKYYTFLQEAQ